MPFPISIFFEFLKVLLLFDLIFCVSLDEMVCRIRRDHCKKYSIPSNGNFLSKLRPQRPRNFDSWSLYGLESGNGYGPPGGQGYAPGMGDVAINTGLGIRTPIGGLGIQQGFGFGIGGSGRIGGMPIGFGNGFGMTGSGRYFNGR